MYTSFISVEIVQLTKAKEEPLHHEPKPKDEQRLDIYCYPGKTGDVWKKLPNLFRSANVSTAKLLLYDHS